MKVDWWALLQVGGVTVFAAVAIAALMNAANWCFTTPTETTATPGEPSLRAVGSHRALRNVAAGVERWVRGVVFFGKVRLALGVVLMGITCVLVLFGLYLMIPYFR